MQIKMQIKMEMSICERALGIIKSANVIWKCNFTRLSSFKGQWLNQRVDILNNEV